VLAVGLVVAVLGVILFVRPDAMTKFGRNLFLVVLVLWAVSHVPIFREGVGILSERFTESAEAAETSIVGGLFSRALGGFTEAIVVLPQVPLAGYGLGIGTNGGARFLMGHAAFLLTENEWQRILLESGSILGLAFLVWRALLTIRIGYIAFRALTVGNTLPILLYAAGFLALANGPLGQPTSVGFAVILNGLCLAAVRTKEDTSAPTQPKPSMQKPRAVGRSAYASRLHGPAEPDRKTNGAVDR
jgi:hypothetical protein